jgi:hypothetical protein
MRKAFLALAPVICAAARTPALGALLAALTAVFVSPAGAADPTEFTNSVAIGNFSVSYPDGWSTLKSGRLTMILNVPPDQQATLGDQFVFTPEVSISTEQRLDDSDTLQQLDEIAAGAGASVTRLTVGGWPAIQWRKTVPWTGATHSRFGADHQHGCRRRRSVDPAVRKPAVRCALRDRRHDRRDRNQPQPFPDVAVAFVPRRQDPPP